MSTGSASGEIRWGNNRDGSLAFSERGWRWKHGGGGGGLWDAQERWEIEWSVPESWQLSRQSSQSSEKEEKQSWWQRKILELEKWKQPGQRNTIPPLRNLQRVFYQSIRVIRRSSNYPHVSLPGVELQLEGLWSAGWFQSDNNTQSPHTVHI